MAHLFVQTANARVARLTVGRTDGDERVDGKSIMAMMMLAAERGTELGTARRRPGCGRAGAGDRAADRGEFRRGLTARGPGAAPGFRG
ncbi:MAG: HPr family phosphocarrier protein [Planctomycetes bacterium]|nr:HPr family phosphocarrier protein [Planctomycetota bacterium]